MYKILYDYIGKNQEKAYRPMSYFERTSKPKMKIDGHGRNNSESKINL